MNHGPIWFETHAHLSDSKFDADRDAVIERAFSSGLSAIVEIADGPDEWPKAKALAEKYPNKVWWAAGLHPYYADKASPDLWAQLKTLTGHPQFLAIGEVGLDYAKCPIPPIDQIKAFRRAIELGIETHKPLIIHCREAYSDLMPILREYFANPSREFSPGVVHCFSGDRANAEELISLGFYLGVDGPITYPSAKSLRDALAGIAPHHLVIETDSPYLPPQNYRGQRNEPAYLPLIGDRLAAHLNIEAEKLSEITTRNAHQLFRTNRVK